MELHRDINGARLQASRELGEDMWGVAGVWLLALLAFLAPPWLATAWGTDALGSWVGAYFAGGFGGLVLELTASRGQLELPSTRGQQPDPSEDEAAQMGNPLGRQVDLGFFGRMMLGALAAFTVLLLAKFLSVGAESRDFAESATSVATLAWAVAIGFTSPAAWAAIKRLAESRYKSALSVQKEKNKEKTKLATHAKKKLDHAKDKFEEGRRRPLVDASVRRQLMMAVSENEADPIIELLGVPDLNAEEAASAVDEARGVLESLTALGE